MGDRCFSLPRHAATRFQLWWSQLPAVDRKAYGDAIGMTVSNIKANYMRPLELAKYDKKKPTKSIPNMYRIRDMVKASKGKLCRKNILDHFFPDL